MCELHKISMEKKYIPNHTGSDEYLDQNQEDFSEDEYRTLFCVPLHPEHWHQKE